MMGSDMATDELSSSAARALTRRAWMAHCSVSLAALGTVLPMASHAATKAEATKAGSGPVILVVGDSLSAEYGLKRGTGWVALLDARLVSDKSSATVVNASISGDTTSGGRTRLPTLLAQHKPGIVVIELGANDALRGLPLAMTRDNLSAMVEAAKAAGARVLIVGMQLPPNYGRQYGDEFAGLFASVAQVEHTALVPFLLKGVADGPHADTAFQADRIHPLATEHPILLDNVWAVLKPMLAKAG
jgi:acyl-CoA thioesterase-1